jgi:hypothetical protein
MTPWPVQLFLYHEGNESRWIFFEIKSCTSFRTYTATKSLIYDNTIASLTAAVLFWGFWTNPAHFCFDCCNAAPLLMTTVLCRFISNHLVDLQSILFFLLWWRYSPTRAGATPLLRFLLKHKNTPTVCRTPLDGWSARSRDVYLTTHSERHTSPGGIQTRSSRKQTAVDRIIKVSIQQTVQRAKINTWNRI